LLALPDTAAALAPVPAAALAGAPAATPGAQTQAADPAAPKPNG
jgi:hypothetical protein